MVVAVDQFDLWISQAAQYAKSRKKNRNSSGYQLARRQAIPAEERTTGNYILPFIGVDGEGAGTDEHGRQNFLLLQAGNRTLFDQNRPLDTESCLEFLLGLPPDAIAVGYFFNYDATMILRDLDRETMAKLFVPKSYEEGKSPYTKWRDYGIDYTPRQYFRVTQLSNGRAIPGDSRTVNDVGSFFQDPFLKALDKWSIPLTAEHRERIAAGKARRGSLELLSAEDLRYCALECDLLEKLMETFRTTCIQVDIVPEKWRGAGWIASALHKKHNSPRNAAADREPDLTTMATGAYYGGRFETTRAGRIPGPIYEYDICSAYPAAMLDLPCNDHTLWHQFGAGAELPGKGYYLCDLSFKFRGGSSNLYGLPIRSKQSRLFWPRQGRGVYWSPEIKAAIDAGCSIKVHGGWHAERTCNCERFGWLRELYLERLRVGKASKGYALRLGYNGAYGKLCQRVGKAPYRDIIAAGLITSLTRAKLIHAYIGDPDSCIMLATDGVYSLKPLPHLPISTTLGEWECKEYPNGMFIVQPGFYWPNGEAKIRTRGVPERAVTPLRQKFEAEWDAFMERGDVATPVVPVPITTFIGARLGLQRTDPFASGQWKQIEKNIAFSWHHKRWFESWRWCEGHVWTYPWQGGPDLVSYSYDGRVPDVLEQQAIEFEAMPDYMNAEDYGE